MTCPLCGDARPRLITSPKDPLVYGHCLRCDLRFLRPDQRLRAGAERARYETHRYAYDDAGYARFVDPLITALVARVSAGSRGLDFGAGRVPVLARWLEGRGYLVDLYDAFYWPDERPLLRSHEFIVSCETIEHVFEPALEFSRLRRLLVPGAPLIVMTDIWDERGDFHDWYYRRDPTHVSFYSPRTFDWIARAFGFSLVERAGRVVCLNTPGG